MINIVTASRTPSRTKERVLWSLTIGAVVMVQTSTRLIVAHKSTIKLSN